MNPTVLRARSNMSLARRNFARSPIKLSTPARHPSIVLGGIGNVPCANGLPPVTVSYSSARLPNSARKVSSGMTAMSAIFPA